MSIRTRAIAAIIALACMGLALLRYQIELTDAAVAVLYWTRGLGWPGMLVVGLAYMPASVFLLPASLLTLSAGFLFGLWKGVLVAMLGNTAGAAAAFLVGRAVVHDWVQRRIGRKPAFRATADAIAGDGFKVVVLVRLSPLFPANVMNYVLSITKVCFRRYVLGTLVGMLPGTVLFVYVGSTARSLTAIAAGEIERNRWHQGLFYAGLLVAFGVSTLITLRARKMLKTAAR